MSGKDSIVESIAELWRDYFKASGAGSEDEVACDEVGGMLLTALVIFAVEYDFARDDSRISDLVVSAARGLNRRIRQARLLYQHIEDQGEGIK